MIKKDKLLKQIDDLISLEKSIVPLLNKHVSTSLFFSNLKKNEREEVIAYFQNLVIAKTRHIEILNMIKTGIGGSKKDVY